MEDENDNLIKIRSRNKLQELSLRDDKKLVILQLVSESKNIKITENQKDLFVSKIEKTEQDKQENLVKKTCRELGITQKELAERIGVSQEALSRWSNGQKIPKTVETLFQALLKINRMSNIESELINFRNKLDNLILNQL